ncbi:histidine protein methyltransferase 1 homolog isoform X2 [Zophobas morio]|uniref:histidine protein methyltransferase 1 homolog isoform X2 n=1 Tax=Zophobas morio TaxID=2755281 RepID=UPI0030833A66
MFKFGFSNENVENETNESQSECVNWLESREIKPEDVILRNHDHPNVIHCDNYDIKYISDKDIVDTLRHDGPKNDNSVLNAEQNHSDLIPAVYEGGLKIWECTFDLLEFIKNLDLNEKRVLDLGCGGGVVGIYASLKGATTVFQDYNKEVIKSATIPNVFLNNIASNKCRFYYGDWNSFLDLQKQTENKFDFIFTSETIYNVNNYKKILTIFRDLLHKNGEIFLAAKSHYFGVGGGIVQFEDALKKEDVFNHTTHWVCSDGLKRAIIKISLK